MTDLGRRRSKAAVELLLDVAGPDLYRENAFRVTGLTTTATARQVRQRRQLALAAAELGAQSQLGDPRLPSPRPVAERELRRAFDAVDDAEERLVHELFWWWSEDLSCGCEPRTHELHDLAVAAHAEALDIEAGLAGGHAEKSWYDAADSWLDALDTADFWAHVRHRARVLGDRRIDESTVAGLAEAMTRALLAPLVELARRSPEPARLAALVREWDLEPALIDDALEAVAEPTYQAGKELVRELQRLVDEDDAVVAASRALGEIPGAAEQLEALLPHARFRRSASLRNQMAVVLNNCALAVHTRAGHRDLAPRLLALAADLVVDEDDRETIRINTRGLVTASPYGPARPTPAPDLAEHTWALNLASSLALVTVMVFALVVWLQLPTWQAVIATVAAAPAQLHPAYSDRYRDAWWPSTAGKIALPAAVLALGYAATWDWAAVLWCFGAYVLALPVTCAVARASNGR